MDQGFPEGSFPFVCRKERHYGLDHFLFLVLNIATLYRYSSVNLQRYSILLHSTATLCRYPIPLLHTVTVTLYRCLPGAVGCILQVLMYRVASYLLAPPAALAILHNYCNHLQPSATVVQLLSTSGHHAGGR